MNELVEFKSPESKLDYVMKVANIFMKSGKFGKDYNVETVAMLVMYAHELGVSPAQALINGFDIIQGKISMKPALMSNMIRRAGHSLKILKWEADECIIKGKRADNGDEITISFSMEDAKRAGWSEKAVYKQNPKNMLYARCMGNLGRMLFGDVIGNPYAEDEIFETQKKEAQLMTRPEQTVDASAEVINDSPTTIGIERNVDELVKACSEGGVKTDKFNLLQFVLTLRDSKNAKGGKQVSEQDIIQSAFLPGQMERFCQMLLDYLSQPIDPLAEVESQ
jgi:hypothetical protein